MKCLFGLLIGEQSAGGGGGCLRTVNAEAFISPEMRFVCVCVFFLMQFTQNTATVRKSAPEYKPEKQIRYSTTSYVSGPVCYRAI